MRSRLSRLSRLSRWRRFALACSTLAASGCTEVLVPQGAGVTPAGIFDQVWRDFDRYYALFSVRNVDWNAMYAKYLTEAQQAPNSGAIAATIGRLFAELKDPHVDLAVPPAKYYTSVDLSAIRTFFTPNNVFVRYVAVQKRSPSRNLHFGMVDADIGYVWIASFGGTGWSGEIDAVIESFGTAKAVIVDVRNNGGGNSETAEAIASRFASSRYRFAYVRYRNGPRHDDLTAFRGIDIVPKGPWRFTGPVVVLTNRGVMSASEHFVLAMRERANTESVGDTTVGAQGNPLIRILPNGWTYRVPQWIEYDAAKRTYEALGIAPAVAVNHSVADSSAGRDPQLEAAIARARLRIP